MIANFELAVLRRFIGLFTPPSAHGSRKTRTFQLRRKPRKTAPDTARDYVRQSGLPRGIVRTRFATIDDYCFLVLIEDKPGFHRFSWLELFIQVNYGQSNRGFVHNEKQINLYTVCISWLNIQKAQTGKKKISRYKHSVTQDFCVT